MSLFNHGTLGSLVTGTAVILGSFGASLAMALGLWLSAPWLDAFAPPLALALLVAGGGLAFLVVGLLLGALDLGDLRRVLGRGRG